MSRRCSDIPRQESTIADLCVCLLFLEGLVREGWGRYGIAKPGKETRNMPRFLVERAPSHDVTVFHSLLQGRWMIPREERGYADDDRETMSPRFDPTDSLIKVQLCTRARHWTRRTTDPMSCNPQRRSVPHEHHQAVVSSLP